MFGSLVITRKELCNIHILLSDVTFLPISIFYFDMLFTFLIGLPAAVLTLHLILFCFSSNLNPQPFRQKRGCESRLCK